MVIQLCKTQDLGNNNCLLPLTMLFPIKRVYGKDYRKLSLHSYQMNKDDYSSIGKRIYPAVLIKVALVAD